MWIWDVLISLKGFIFRQTESNSFIWCVYCLVKTPVTLSCLGLWDSLLPVHTEYHVIRSVYFTHPVNFLIFTHTHTCTLPLFVSVNNKKNAVSPVVMLMRVCVGFVEKLKAPLCVCELTRLLLFHGWCMKLSEVLIHIRVWTSSLLCFLQLNNFWFLSIPHGRSYSWHAR